MFGIDSGNVLAVLIVLWALFTTSYFFDCKITALGNKLEGLDWVLVVIGVSYTLIGIGILDLVLQWNAFFISALAFGVSGFPMMHGAAMRHNETKARARKAISDQ